MLEDSRTREYICFVILVSIIGIFLLVCYILHDDTAAGLPAVNDYESESHEISDDPNTIEMINDPNVGSLMDFTGSFSRKQA